MAGARSGAAALALVLTGCIGAERQVEIRAMPVPLSMKPQPVPERIAEARAQVALGNVALGLELFRKASREDPGSAEALAGMADCYAKMARFDLSQRYLEQALALAPADRGLLTALAATFDRQGRPDEARAVRSELALRAATPAAPIATAQATVNLPAPVAIAGAGEETPRVAAPAAAVTVALPSPEPRPASGPRLERVSLGEVALVTSGAPRWARDLAAETRVRSGTAAKAPLQLAQVRLLNAARIPGLAARTRALLAGNGWSRLTIGDSTRVRQQSLILYSERNALVARRLSAQIGVAMAAAARPGDITVLLGTDAVGRKLRRS